MTDHQWETIQRSLIGLSSRDKLELVERLVNELQVITSSDVQSMVPRITELTEEMFKHRLLGSGLMSSLPTPCDPALRPAFQPITLEGEPLSETIVRERR